MSASKDRLLWEQLPIRIRREIEHLAGDSVVAAGNCPGGFSPGLAARLSLAGGGLAFAKAMDAAAWPAPADLHRAEIGVSAVLPPQVPAPRLLGSFDDGRWVALVFEHARGAELDLRRRPADAHRAAAALAALAMAATPSPVDVPGDHPRLGGWAALERDQRRKLPALSGWAAGHLGQLAALERDGLALASGQALVHFDAFAHNMLLDGDRLTLVDWPHARLGAPFLDLIMFAAGAAADGVDPERLLAAQPVTASLEPHVVDAVLAAFAGFCAAGALTPVPAALAPVTAAKTELARAATAWLERRLRRKSGSGPGPGVGRTAT